MKLVLTTTLVAGLTASALGQESGDGNEQIKQAETLIADVAKAYKDVKALTDTVELKMETPMGQESMELTVTMGSGHDAIVDFAGFSLVVVGDKVHFLREDVFDKYFAAPLEGTLTQTLESVFGEPFPLPPHFAMRDEATLQKQMAGLTRTLTLGLPMENLRLTGYREIEQEEGPKVLEATFTAEGGKGAMQVDSRTKLLRGMQVELTPPGAPPGLTIKSSIALKPKTYESLPTAIAFNAGDRKAVESLDKLEPTPIAKGAVAPDFTLSDLKGETVTLSKLNGSVVVIDFWATWCQPCRMALPLLDEFATWAEESGQPVKVYAINVMERFKDADQRKEKISEFWTNGKYKVTTLLDMDNKVFPRYGIGGIPATIVIGPDGKVFAVHEGFSPDMVDMLKKDVAEALKTTG